MKLLQTLGLIGAGLASLLQGCSKTPSVSINNNVVPKEGDRAILQLPSLIKPPYYYAYIWDLNGDGNIDEAVHVYDVDHLNIGVDLN